MGTAVYIDGATVGGLIPQAATKTTKAASRAVATPGAVAARGAPRKSELTPEDRISLVIHCQAEACLDPELGPRCRRRVFLGPYLRIGLHRRETPPGEVAADLRNQAQGVASTPRRRRGGDARDDGRQGR